MPVVTLLTKGEPGSLKDVEELLKKGLPVVVVKGSGGVADVLAYAVFAYVNGQILLLTDLS